MISVFSGSFNTAGQAPQSGGPLPAVSPASQQALGALQDLLLLLVVSTLAGTSPTLTVVVEQQAPITGVWTAVAGGTLAVVNAVGTYSFIVHGPFGGSATPYRIRVVDGGTVTNATFTLSRDT